MNPLHKERLRRAGVKVRDENPMFAGDTGFRVFKLDSTNIQAWEPDRADLEQTIEGAVDHLKVDRSEQDILFELLLKLGLDLCVPIERREIAGKGVHAVGGGVLLVCLAPTIAREDVEALAGGDRCLACGARAGWRRHLCFPRQRLHGRRRQDESGRDPGAARTQASPEPVAAMPRAKKPETAPGDGAVVTRPTSFDLVLDGERVAADDFDVLRIDRTPPSLETPGYEAPANEIKRLSVIARRHALQ